MTEEGRKTQLMGEVGTSSSPITAQGAPPPSVLLPAATKGTVVIARPSASAPAPAPSPPPTLRQAEEGHATARKESVEQCRKDKVKNHIELSGIATVFGFVVLLGLFYLPEKAKSTNSMRVDISVLLALATFLSGEALMLLSMNMLGLPDNPISGGRRFFSKSLIVVCTVLPIMTLASLLALLPSMLMFYFCLGLAVVTAVVLAVVAAYCHLWRRAEGADEEAAYEGHKEELDAASKITSSVTSSAFGGLVGMLFSASKYKEGFGATAPAAVYAAIFFMFTTTISGMLVMTAAAMVTKRSLSRFHVWANSLANTFLLCSLACGAFAASFAVVGCQFFASFAPLAITGVIYLTLQSCTVRRGRADPRNHENEEARLKATEDIASKVAAATMSAIMTVLAGSIGENGREKTRATELFMVVLTSTFVSSFGFMLVAAVPSSARLCLAPISKLLVWSSVALFAAAAVSVYGAEVFRAASQ